MRESEREREESIEKYINVQKEAQKEREREREREESIEKYIII